MHKYVTQKTTQYEMNTDPKLVKEAVEVKKDLTNANSKKQKLKSLYQLATIYGKLKKLPKK